MNIITNFYYEENTDKFLSYFSKDFHPYLLEKINRKRIHSEKVSSLIQNAEKDLTHLIKTTGLKGLSELKYGQDIFIWVFPTKDSRTKYGIGGNAIGNKLILLFIEPQAIKTPKEIQRLVLHEIHHTAFLNQHSKGTLADQLVMEGSADLFASQQLNINPPKWATSLSKRKMLPLMEIALNNLDRTDLYDAIFHGNKDIPAYAGYNLGLRLMQKFFNNHSISWDKLLYTKSEDIIQLVRKELK